MQKGQSVAYRGKSGITFCNTDDYKYQTWHLSRIYFRSCLRKSKENLSYLMVSHVPCVQTVIVDFMQCPLEGPWDVPAIPELGISFLMHVRLNSHALSPILSPWWWLDHSVETNAGNFSNLELV